MSEKRETTERAELEWHLDNCACADPDGLRAAIQRALDEREAATYDRVIKLINRSVIEGIPLMRSIEMMCRDAEARARRNDAG